MSNKTTLIEFTEDEIRALLSAVWNMHLNIEEREKFDSITTKLEKEKVKFYEDDIEEDF